MIYTIFLTFHSIFQAEATLIYIASAVSRNWVKSSGWNSRFGSCKNDFAICQATPNNGLWTKYLGWDIYVNIMGYFVQVIGNTNFLQFMWSPPSKKTRKKKINFLEILSFFFSIYTFAYILFMRQWKWNLFLWYSTGCGGEE